MFNNVNPPPFKDEIPLFDESHGTAPISEPNYPAVDEYTPAIPEPFEMEEEVERRKQEQVEILFSGSED